MVKPVKDNKAFLASHEEVTLANTATLLAKCIQLYDTQRDV